MRKFLIFLGSVAIASLAGCHSKMALPSHNDLIASETLTAQWSGKCNGHDLDDLDAAEKQNFCIMVSNAVNYHAIVANGKAQVDLLRKNTLRK